MRRNHIDCWSRKNEYRKLGHKRPDLRMGFFLHLFLFFWDAWTERWAWSARNSSYMADPPLLFSNLGEGIEGWFGWMRQDDDDLWWAMDDGVRQGIGDGERHGEDDGTGWGMENRARWGMDDGMRWGVGDGARWGIDDGLRGGGGEMVWDNEMKLEKNVLIHESNGLAMLWWTSPQELPESLTIKHPFHDYRQEDDFCRIFWHGLWQ